MREAILAVLEKNSRIDLADLAALLGVTEAEVANEISEMSHAEEAWRQNEKQHSLIDYSYAFDLRQL